MIFSWLKRRRRRKILAGPFPPQWKGWIESLPFFSLLSEDEKRTLENDTRVLVSEKHWEGCGGMEVTDEVKVTVAAQAALLLLGLDHDYFRSAGTVFVYPSTFMVPDRRADAAGVVSDGRKPTLGLASLAGPVVLAWDSVRHGGADHRDGRNVVLHEFAHKLDMLDRFADGAPPLRSREQYRAWHRIMTDEFDRLTEDAERGRRTLLDVYGATSPAEFFAVATEAFFEKGEQLERKHPELYALLRAYYRQHPADWRRRRAGGTP